MIELAVFLTLAFAFVVIASIVLAMVGLALKLTVGVLKLVLLPFVLMAGLFVCLAAAPVFVGAVGLLVVFCVVAIPMLILGGVVWLGAHLLAPVA